MTRPNINPSNVSPDPAPDAQASRIMSTHYACIMTQWHQNASRVAGPLYGFLT